MLTPGKLVVLKLDGDLEQQGFRVALEIGLEGDRPFIERLASLPNEPELVRLLEQWQQAYRRLGTTNRIMPLEIRYEGSVNWREDCQKFANQLRDRFNTWLDAPSFRPLDQRLREYLNPNDPVRLFIRTQDQKVRHLPWHLWNWMEHYPQAEIALGSLVIERIGTTKTIPSTGKVKILAILGNRIGINVEHDRQILEQLPNADVTFLVEPARQQITRQLWEQPWQILFFAGHSRTEGTQGRIYLNPQESLTLEELKYGLRRAIAQGLQLAIFNSCDGLGLAQELESLHLPRLIVMREPVPDPVAQTFLKYFLTALVQGEPLHLAARQAREQLQGLEGEFPCASWLPVLCQNSVDPSLDWQGLLGYREPPTINPAQPEQNRIAATVPARKLPASFDWLCLRIVFCTSVAVTFLTMGLRWLGILQPLELPAYDQMVQLQAGPGLDSRLLIVTVNDRDVQQLGDPLSDRTIHHLLTRLEKFQPRVIGLDIYRDFSQKEGWKDLVHHLQTSDRTVVLCRIGDFNRVQAIPPAPGIPQSRLGFSDAFVPDPDRSIRRYVLVMDASESPCATPYSFSFQIVRRFLPPETLYHYEPGSHISINTSRFELIQPNTGGYQLSAVDTLGYQILIPYRSTQMAQQVSLTDVLTGADTELQTWIQNRIVLIGYVGENAKVDYHRTPLGEMAGVLIHAQVVSQLLKGVLEEQSPVSSWPPIGDTFWAWGWSVGGGIIAWKVRSCWSRNLIVSMAVVGLGGSCLIWLIQSIWVPLVPSAITLVATASITAYLMPRVQPK